MAELTIRERAGDEETVNLEALIAEHQRMVYRIAYGLLRNHHDAEDAAQETFLRVWRAASKLASVADHQAWIARIAWNAATDRLREKGPRAEAPLDEVAASIASAHVRGHSAEDIASGAELQRLLEGLIAGLPRKLREVLVLSTVEELGNDEIGRVLGLQLPGDMFPKERPPERLAIPELSIRDLSIPALESINAEPQGSSSNTERE